MQGISSGASFWVPVVGRVLGVHASADNLLFRCTPSVTIRNPALTLNSFKETALKLKRYCSHPMARKRVCPEARTIGVRLSLDALAAQSVVRLDMTIQNRLLVYSANLQYAPDKSPRRALRRPSSPPNTAFHSSRYRGEELLVRSHISVVNRPTCARNEQAEAPRVNQLFFGGSAQPHAG